MPADQSLLEPRPGERGRAERESDGETEHDDGTVVVPQNERVDSERYVSVALEAARYRHENERLRERVGELEDELAASDRRRRSIVMQYERILQDRESTGRADPESRGLVARVWRAVAGRR